MGQKWSFAVLEAGPRRANWAGEILMEKDEGKAMLG